MYNGRKRIRSVMVIIVLLFKQENLRNVKAEKIVKYTIYPLKHKSITENT